MYFPIVWWDKKFLRPCISDNFLKGSFMSSSIQSLSCVRLFVTSQTAARQASLSINSRSLLKLMSTESGMPSDYLILCRPLLLLPSIFPSIEVFSDESAVWIRWPTSASASVLPMNIQDWFPLGLTGLICLQSKGLSRVFSNNHISLFLPFPCDSFL